MSRGNTKGHDDQMELASFRIDYVDDDNTHLHAEAIKVMDHFDACEHGWSHMPERAADFQVTEVTP